MKHLLNDTKSILATVLTAVLACTAVPAFAQYGSIAFSSNTEAGYGWGFSWGYGSRQDAKYRAVRECRDKGGANCAEIGWFHNNCGALAISPEGGYGTGYGNTRVAAESKALSACRSAGNSNCRIPISRCATVTVAKSSGFVVKRAQPVKLNREQMRKVQKALAAQGTNPGPADGIYGAKTRAAIQDWQSRKGYAATGVLTNVQIQMLIETSQQTTVARASKDLYGSIAFSQEYDGSYAYAIVWNSGGREMARIKAVNSCRLEGGSNCAELGRFRNICASLAIGDRGGAGTGGGKVIAEAEQNALTRCRNAGTTNCRIEVSRCTDTAMEIAAVRKPAVAERKAVTVTQTQTQKEGGCPGGVTIGEYRYQQNGAYNWHKSSEYDAFYTGELCNGKPNGEGEILFVHWGSNVPRAEPWVIYQGEVQNGRPHGKGTYYDTYFARKGEKLFNGEWREGFPFRGMDFDNNRQMHDGPNGRFSGRPFLWELLDLTSEADERILHSDQDILSESWKYKEDSGWHYVGE